MIQIHVKCLFIKPEPPSHSENIVSMTTFKNSYIFTKTEFNQGLLFLYTDFRGFT